uniref:Bola-like protein n=1 Tax=Hanusia phi TaxID=3032 RepID=A0A7S0E088_9CRYP|mmetsp:Transcript_14085/g.32481  ORF Transcript_14085/g.32481 Transcript_14085/m.32481 type:complete len:131 (+) Transcript_14085:41-433(+)
MIVDSLRTLLRNSVNYPKCISKSVTFAKRSMSTEGKGPVYTSIWNLVNQNLEPTHMELVDDSAKHAGHAAMKDSTARESHFKLKVVSAKFEGLSLVKRHQLVYGLLNDQFKDGLHALNIVAKTPQEVAKP